MHSIGEKGGFPLETEDAAEKVIAEIRLRIPHATDGAIGTMFAWHSMMRETRARTDEQGPTEGMSLRGWLDIRREEALKIDPATAEVRWNYAEVGDPYGVCADFPDVVGDLLPEKCERLYRAYFARRPGSEVWVCFHDLPEKTEDALWERYKSKLAGGEHRIPTPEEISSVISEMLAAEPAGIRSDNLDDLWSSEALDAWGQFQGYGFGRTPAEARASAWVTTWWPETDLNAVPRAVPPDWAFKICPPDERPWAH
jgi:hypothetical protein